MAEFISVVKAGTSDAFAINVSHIRVVTSDVPVGGKPTSRILLTSASSVTDLQIYGDLKTILKSIRSAK